MNKGEQTRQMIIEQSAPIFNKKGIAATAMSDIMDATDLSITNVRRDSDGGPDTNFTLLEGVERNAIVQMLKETGGNKLETAKRLGIGRQTLYNKIKAYGIEV